MIFFTKSREQTRALAPVQNQQAVTLPARRRSRCTPSNLCLMLLSLATLIDGFFVSSHVFCLSTDGGAFGIKCTDYEENREMAREEGKKGLTVTGIIFVILLLLTLFYRRRLRRRAQPSAPAPVELSSRNDIQLPEATEQDLLLITHCMEGLTKPAQSKRQALAKLARALGNFVVDLVLDSVKADQPTAQELARSKQKAQAISGRLAEEKKQRAKPGLFSASRRGRKLLESEEKYFKFKKPGKQFTFDAEGFEGGKLHTRKPHVPTDSSGLTVGRGFDLRRGYKPGQKVTEKDRKFVYDTLRASGLSHAQATLYKNAVWTLRRWC